MEEREPGVQIQGAWGFDVEHKGLGVCHVPPFLTGWYPLMKSPKEVHATVTKCQSWLSALRFTALFLGRTSLVLNLGTVDVYDWIILCGSLVGSLFDLSLGGCWASSLASLTDARSSSQL